MSDKMVKSVQEWYNTTYVGKTGYSPIEADGISGSGTCKALIKALQIELGISTPNGNFGPGTISAFNSVGINSSTTNRNLIRILQGGFYCKGIECGGFDGGYGAKLAQAVSRFKSMTGVGGSDTIDARHMKALLNTDPFVLNNSNGNSTVRSAQQFLNNKYSSYYWESIGLIPCNGIVERNMTKALAYALQYEEGERGTGLDGIVGTNTLNKAPILSEGSDKSNFVKLLQIGLLCMTDEDPGLDGVFGFSVTMILSEFQKLMCLNQDTTVTLGVACRKTWAAILLSRGDTSRYCDACDTSFLLTTKKANALKRNGYNYVGRYLTGTVLRNGVREDKSLSLQEIEDISKAGLNIFAIYQDGGASSTYFSHSRGYSDAQKAIEAAKALRIPAGQIIYFAVDYDFMADQTLNIIVPHFMGINEYFDETGSKYRIGIYGSRNICSVVSTRGLACSSFVADMSTAFSGNMGYPMPSNWAFDQFHEFKFTNYSDFDGAFDLDKNVASGRYTGFKRGVLTDDTYKFPTDLEVIRTEVENATDINDIISLIEQVEDIYNDNYINIGNTIGMYAPKAILSLLYADKYPELKWDAVAPQDDEFIKLFKIHYKDLYNKLKQYIVPQEDEKVVLLTDKVYGIFELPHLAVGIRTFLGSLVPGSWSSWAGDFATGVLQTGVSATDQKSYEQSATETMGKHEEGSIIIQYNYCDLIANGDSYAIAEIIKDNTDYGVHLLSYALRKYYITDRLFCDRYTRYLETFVADWIISSNEFGISQDDLSQRIVDYFNTSAVEFNALRNLANEFKNNQECIKATSKAFINSIKYLNILNDTI